MNTHCPMREGGHTVFHVGVLSASARGEQSDVLPALAWCKLCGVVDMRSRRIIMSVDVAQTRPDTFHSPWVVELP